MCRLLPLLLPASPSCACGLDAWLPPTTTAPTGRPEINPATDAAGVPGVGSPVKKYPARENPNRADVHDLRRENVRFFEAQHLLAQSEQVGGVCIEQSRGRAAAVVVRVGRGQRIFRGKQVIEARGSEIFANRLHGAAGKPPRFRPGRHSPWRPENRETPAGATGHRFNRPKP